MELAELKPIRSRQKAGQIVVALKAMALSKGPRSKGAVVAGQ
jgi:hypothetical protein